MPILRLGDTLVTGLLSELDDTAAMALAEELSDRIVSDRARGVLLDISRVEILDSFVARALMELSTMAQLLGARVIVAGHAARGRHHAGRTRHRTDGCGDRVARRGRHDGVGLAAKPPPDAVPGGGQGRGATDPHNPPPPRPRRHQATAPASHPSQTLQVRTEADLLTARHAVRSATQALGFRLVDQTRVVTAASELARNAHIHGGGGTLTVETLHQARGAGLRLTVSDEGPGIADLEGALTDGFTTGAGLGRGLGGARRLMHDFDIRTVPGQGTVVTAIRWADR